MYFYVLEILLSGGGGNCPGSICPRGVIVRGVIVRGVIVRGVIVLEPFFSKYISILANDQQFLCYVLKQCLPGIELKALTEVYFTVTNVKLN